MKFSNNKGLLMNNVAGSVAVVVVHTGTAARLC